MVLFQQTPPFHAANFAHTCGGALQQWLHNGILRMVSGFWHFETFWSVPRNNSLWWPILGEKEERICCTSAAFFTPWTILSISNGLFGIFPHEHLWWILRGWVLSAGLILVKINLSIPFALFNFLCHGQFFLLSYTWELLLQLFILSLGCVRGWMYVCMWCVSFQPTFTL